MKNDMNVEWWPIQKITPYARNARKIPESAVDKVAASIREFSWRQPLVVDSAGVIIAGHARLLAARKLELERVPVHVADNLTPAQVKAYRLMDNRSHQETDWDIELLGPELLELKGLEFDLNLTGFDTREIDQLLALNSGDDDAANAAPELPANPVVRAGELWRCGPHRVLCADSTSADAVSRLLCGAKPFLMVTDPPYGVEYDPEWREEAGLGHQRQVGKVSNDDKADWTVAYRFFPGDVAYVWHAGVHAAEVAVGMLSAGFQIRSQIIWAKQHFALSRGAYHWQHEPCWYAVRKGNKSGWRGDRTQSTVWQVANLNPFGGNKEESTGHGTQKPIELMRRPILNHTDRGQIVYDPFLGSGTTLIAAEETERICFAMDIDPRYVEMAMVRFQQFSGEAATLDDDGRTFEQIRQERLAALNEPLPPRDRGDRRIDQERPPGCGGIVPGVGRLVGRIQNPRSRGGKGGIKMKPSGLSKENQLRESLEQIARSRLDNELHLGLLKLFERGLLRSECNVATNPKAPKVIWMAQDKVCEGQVSSACRHDMQKAMLALVEDRKVAFGIVAGKAGPAVWFVAAEDAIRSGRYQQ